MHFLCNVRLGNGRIQVQKYRGKMFSPCSVDTWMRGQCYVQYLIPRPSIKSHLNENNKSKSLICWESSCCFGLQWANDQLTLKRGFKMVKSELRPTIANNRLTIKKLKWDYPYFWSMLFRQKTKKETPADSVDWASKFIAALVITPFVQEKFLSGESPTSIQSNDLISK